MLGFKKGIVGLYSKLLTFFTCVNTPAMLMTLRSENMLAAILACWVGFQMSVPP